MLAELAITPHIFDPESNTDFDAWRNALTALRFSLHHTQDSNSALVISGLHGDTQSGTCTLEHQLREQIGALLRVDGLPDDLRKLTEDVFEKLRARMVIRPQCTDWPTDESDWFEETNQSDAVYAIPQKIGSLDGTRSQTTHASLESVNDPTFWESSQIITHRPTGTTERAQMVVLESVLTHAQHYLITIPYRSMQPYLVELLRTLYSRPTGFESPQAHIFIVGEQTGFNPRSWTKHVRHLLHKDGITDGDQHAVMHYLTERSQVFRARVILGSVLRPIADDRYAPSARFGVSLTHAPEGDPSQDNIETWSLMSLNEICTARDLILNGAGKYHLESHFLDGTPTDLPDGR